MKHWLLEKHRNNIEITNITSKDLRWDLHTSGLYIMSDGHNEFNSVFDWNLIDRKFAFFYNYEGIEDVLVISLSKSVLINYPTVLVETATDIPILKMEAGYFIKNWLDFIDSKHGMGFIVTSENKELLMEFTDDYKYNLLSNFLII